MASARDILEAYGWRKDLKSRTWIGPNGARIIDETLELETTNIEELIRMDRQGKLKPPIASPTFVGNVVKANNSSDGFLLSSGKWSDTQTPTFSLYDKLNMRLHTQRGDSFGLDYVHIVEGPSITFVMIVHGDKAVILEDDKNLYPSDALVAKFWLTKNSFTS